MVLLNDLQDPVYFPESPSQLTSQSAILMQVNPETYWSREERPDIKGKYKISLKKYLE